MTHSSLSNCNHKDDATTRLPFSQILSLILRRWYWFVLSFILFFVLGMVIVKHRPLGHQTYYMQLSSRQPHELTNPIIPQSDSAFKTSPWTPEYIAALLNTSTAVVEAGKRINFQVDYTVQTLFGPRDYYNQTPIIIHFDDLLPTDQVSCLAKLDNPVTPKQVTLSDFVGIAQGISIESPYDVIIPIGTSLQSPVGRISVTLDNPEHHYPYHIDQTYKELYISYASLTAARNTYETELEVSMKKADLPLSSVIRVDLLSNRSERRCLDLLYEMYVVTDSLGWVEERSDKSGETLTEGVPPVGLSPFKLIDEPRVKSVEQPDLFILAGLGLLGLLLPLLLMYIYWSVKGVIYDPAEIPSLLRNKLQLDITRNKRHTPPHYSDLEELCTIVSPQEHHSTIQFVTPSSVKAHGILITELQQALRKRGISCAVWHLQLATPQQQMTEAQSSVYHTQVTPGLLTATPFLQQFKKLQSEYQLLIIVPPVVDHNPLTYMLSDKFVQETFCCIYKSDTKVRAMRRFINQLQIRQQLDLSHYHTLWID